MSKEWATKRFRSQNRGMKKALIGPLAILGLLLLVIFLVGSFSNAETPLLMNYQGMLLDLETDKPMNGVYSIHFSIYDNETGGKTLWQETQNVTVNDGMFHVLLGSIVPFSGFPGGSTALFLESRWLGIKVGTEDEKSPPQRIEGRILTAGKGQSCPDDMVEMGDYCIDRHQITNGLTWYGAADYCHARGKRLCRISEWLEACDGSPINEVEDMPGRQSQWVDQWVYETSTKAFDAVERGFFRCSSISHPWSQYRPLENKWFRCCR